MQKQTRKKEKIVYTSIALLKKKVVRKGKGCKSCERGKGLRANLCSDRHAASPNTRLI